MTTLVGRLERDGLVERRPDPLRRPRRPGDDHARGLERLLAIREARAAAMEARLAQLDPGEREALAGAVPVLDKLIERAPGP